MSRTRRNQATATVIQPVVRCAVYTRKSTDEGLNRDFNSLDNQRERAEAYIDSQRDQGWTAVSDRYDDGGFTGGNMDRPALRQLLEEITAGKVDCVVVYKVDRLSRSLLDFARILERFDEHQVAFVSVTQHGRAPQPLPLATGRAHLVSRTLRDQLPLELRKRK